MIYFLFGFLFCYVLVNQPTVHSGGVSRRGSVAMAVGAAFGYHNPISPQLCLPLAATIACGN